MADNALVRWWRQLFPASGAAPEAPPRPGGGGAGGGDDEVEPGRAPLPRRYTAPPRDDDPQREAHLGAVLEALADGPLTRDRLGARVGADDWGPGRLEGVVAHGVGTGVLLVDGDGDGATVRARYAD